MSHAYTSSGRTLPVLSELRLQVRAGSYVSLTGESGQGKSTLLALLGGLQRAQGGELVVAGHDLRRLPSQQMARFRSRTIGFVFQHHCLVESLTALENVALAALIDGLTRREAVTRARGLLAQIGLLERAGHLPGRLSGGERQRVAVARAMVNRPALVLADEPTGNLDELNAERVMELIERLRDEYGATLLVVTHDRLLASRAATTLRLREGRLEAA
ncbi:MAG: ABC transporter ATP-binding protein [Candidatus Dormibacteraeota bacterium]|nr:ABC transporter ATP-binding protein [Candidatus Dormibacteraeota bacterium]